MADLRVEIPGSEPRHEDKSLRSPVPPDEPITATIVVRRKPGSPDEGEQLLAGKREPLSREDAEQLTASDPTDLAAIESFAHQYGLHVLSADTARRTVKLSGHAAQFQQAFGVDLGQDGTIRTYRGSITIPENLEGIILAVLGLDTTPVAKHA